MLMRCWTPIGKSWLAETGGEPGEPELSVKGACDAMGWNEMERDGTGWDGMSCCFMA